MSAERRRNTNNDGKASKNEKKKGEKEAPKEREEKVPTTRKIPWDADANWPPDLTKIWLCCGVQSRQK